MIRIGAGCGGLRGHCTCFDDNGQVAQCELSGITFVESLPPATALAAEYSLVMDAIFGFSFKAAGGIRAPFDAVIATLAEAEARKAPHLPVDSQLAESVGG